MKRSIDVQKDGGVVITETDAEGLVTTRSMTREQLEKHCADPEFKDAFAAELLKPDA